MNGEENIAPFLGFKRIKTKKDSGVNGASGLGSRNLMRSQPKI